MRKRTLLTVAPLCVVALAAGAAAAAPNGEEHVSDAKLDKLHAVRPIAASPNDFGLSALRATVDQAVTYVHAIQREQIAAFLGAVAADQAAVGQLVAPTAPTASHSPPGGVLACIRNRESSGDYTAHNSQGTGASGAYQFMQGTWNGIAASSGRPDLVGVDPAAAAPADQDAMAVALYAQQGSAPWGGSC
jgi:Transglycosylase-like domain